MQSIPSILLIFRRFRAFALTCMTFGILLHAPAFADSADQLFQTAQKQYQSGDVNKAIVSLQQALAVRQNDVDALSLLGSCYVELGEFDKAVDSYSRANQIQPGDPGILQGYQSALEGAGQEEPQVPVLGALFQLNPSDPTIGNKYLAILESVGPTKYPQEYIGLLNSLSQAPNADPGYNVKLARFYLLIGKYAQAVPVFQTVLKDDPESVENWKELAQSLEASGDRASAQDAYQKAILYSSNADERATLQQAIKDIGTGKNIPAPVAVSETPQPAAAHLENVANSNASNNGNTLAQTNSSSASAAASDEAAPENSTPDLSAQHQARAEAAQEARAEAAQRAKDRADSIALANSERSERDAAGREFQQEVDAILTQKPGTLDTLTLLTQIQDRRAASRVPDPRLIEAEGILDYYQWNFALATEQFRKLKVLSPLATRFMALSYYEQQDYPNAIKYFTKMPGVREDETDWNKYIHALTESGQRAQAASEYELYLAKNPGSDEALSYLIDFYRSPLQKTKLIPKLEMQLAKNPQDEGLLTDLVSMVDKSSPKAIEYRQRLLAISPDQNNIKYELAQLEEARGDRADAIKYYVAVAGDYAGDKAFNLHLADLLMQEHQAPDAVTYLETAQSADPADKALILRLAGIYEGQNQMDKARDAYLKALDLDPKDKAVQAKLVELFKDQTRDARRDVLMRIEGSDPTAHAVQYELAKMALDDSDKDRAYDYITKALAQQPLNTEYQALLPATVSNEYQVAEHLPVLESLAQRPDATPDLQLLVAQGLLAKQNSLVAARYFELVYAKDPKLLEGNRDAILSLYGVKQYPALVVLTAEYAAITPDDREVRQIQVEALTATGKGGDDLRQAMNGLVQADPVGGTKYLLKLAQLDLQARDTASALQHAQSYLETNPKSVEGWRFLYPLVSGVAGQEDLQIRALEQLWAMDPPGRPRYDRALSQLYFQQQSYDQAQKSLVRAIAAAPTDAALWHLLGQTEMKLSQDAAAAKRFAKAYELQADDVDYARDYGQTLTSQEELKQTLPLWRFLSEHQPTADEQRKFAQSLFLNADYAGSAKEWDGLVKDDPDLANSEPMVAESYAKSGQPARARQILESRLQSDPSNEQLLETVALLYKQEGDTAGYVKSLENLVQVDPHYKGYLLTLAQEKEKAKDDTTALNLYDQWVGQTPNDIAAIKSMRRLADELKDTTRLTDALVRLNRIPGQDIAYRYQMVEIDYLRGGSITEVEKLSRLHPEWTHGKEILVREYMKQGEKAKLVPYIAFLETQSAADKDLLEPLGDAFALLKNNPRANAAYWAWLEANPKNRDIFDKVYGFGKSTSSTYMNQILRLGAQSFPDDADLQRQFAASLGNSPEAVTVYQGILSKEPDTLTLRKAIGVAVAVHQFDLALKWIDQWTELSPDNSQAWETLLSVAQQTGNKQRQIEALNKLAALNPERKDVLQQLGAAYEEESKPDQAVDAYKRLLALDPKNRDVFHKLKTLLAGKEHEEQYQTVLLEVDNADPSAHEAQYDLARIYLAQGDTDKAYEYETKALKLQPQNADYQALLPSVITKDDQVEQYLPVLDRLAQMPDAKPELQYTVAHGYLARKNTAQAVKFLLMVNAKEPKLLEGDKAAILALSAEKQYPASGTLSVKYLAANPTDKEISAVQVEAYLATGRSGPELRSALQRLKENDPDAAAPDLLKLAELDLQAHDSAAALENANAFADKNPKSLEAWRIVYPIAKGKNGQEDTYLKSLEALSVLDTVQRLRYDRELVGVYFQREKYDDAQKVLQKELRINPRDAAFWFQLGEVDSTQHKDSAAATCYARAYQIEPGNLSYARAFGKTLASSEELKSNLVLWRFLSQHEPTTAERQKLAQSLFLNGDYAGSAREYDGLIEKNDSLKATAMVSEAYLKAGQYPKAKVLLEARLPSDSTDMDLLEDLLTLYRAQSNSVGYLNTLDRIVQIDPKRKDYQLQLAQDREKAKDLKGALDVYDLYVSRTGGDLQSLESMQRLADSLKDTVRLAEALVRLNRMPSADVKYKFQMAAVDYARGGTLVPLEKLVRQYPTYPEGKLILVREYLKSRDVAKLAAYSETLDELLQQDRTLSEAGGDAYAQMKQPEKANEAYFTAFNNNKKDKILFDKVYDYAKKTNSPYRLSLLRQGYELFPDDVNLKFDFAQSQGTSPRALQVYTSILASDPSQLPALRNAAEVAVTLGRTDSALILLRLWSQQEPDNIRPWTLLAQLYQRGHKDTAFAEAQGKVSELSPKDGQAAYAAAEAYRKIGDEQRALDFLDRAVALEPENANYEKEQALLMVDLGEADKAKASLLDLNKKFPHDEAINKALYSLYMGENDKTSAREAMRVLYSIKPYSKSYSIALGRLEGELGNPTEVVRVLSRPDLRDTMDAELSFMLLDAYFATNQQDRAAVLGPQLAQKYPEEAKKSLPLAVLFYNMRNEAKAKAILEAYTSEHDTSAEAYYYLGKICYEEKDWNGAIAALEKAGNFKPDVAAMLGEAYAQSGGADKSAQAYEDYYAKTKDPKTLDQLYKLYKQNPNDTTGGLRRTLERLVVVNPNNLDYRAELASLYLAGGQTQKAEEQFQQILTINPYYPLANYRLGIVAARKQDWPRAATMLEIATGRYPDSVMAWLYLGDAYQATKRPEPALMAYKRAQKLSPDDVHAAEGRMQEDRELNLTSDLPLAAAEVMKLDTDNAEASSVLAGLRFQDHKYAEAAELYARVVAQNPDDKEAWSNYGQSLVELKRTAEAKKALQKAVDLGSTDPHVTTSLARIYQQEGNEKQAKALLLAMLQKNPRDDFAYFGLGQIAEDAGQTAMAEQNFHKALELAPGNPEYTEALADLFYKNGDCGKAVQVLETAPAFLTSKGHVIYGDCLVKEGKPGMAMGEFQTGYRKFHSPEALAAMADLYVSQGKIKEAQGLLDTSAEKDDPSIQFSLAKADIASGDLSDARPLLDQLIAQDGQNSGYYFQRGLSWFNERNWVNAQTDFESALKDDSDNSEAAYYRGASLLRQDSVEAAQKSFKKLLKNSDALLQARAYYGMAQVYDGKHKLDTAEAYLNKSIAAKETPEALSMLARVELRLKKPQLAEKPAQRALELNPNDPTAIAALSEVDMALGNKTQALQRISKALANDSTSCDLLLSAAKIQFLAGNFDDSWQSGLAAVSNCPDDPGGYFFLALTSDRKNNKKEAKRFFGEFVKHGGEASNVPAEYQ